MPPGDGEPTLSRSVSSLPSSPPAGPRWCPRCGRCCALRGGPSASSHPAWSQRVSRGLRRPRLVAPPAFPALSPASRSLPCEHITNPEKVGTCGWATASEMLLLGLRAPGPIPPPGAFIPRPAQPGPSLLPDTGPLGLAWQTPGGCVPVSPRPRPVGLARVTQPQGASPPAASVPFFYTSARLRPEIPQHGARRGIA